MTNTQTPLEQRTRLATSTQAAPSKSELERLLEKEHKSVQYVPFGQQDPIKLTVQIVQDLLAIKTKKGRTCSERDARRFVYLCQAQRLNPFAGDAYLVGYDNRDDVAVFSLIVSHLAYLKRAEASPEYEGMESGIIILAENGELIQREGDFCLANENVVGGWAIVHRKGRKPMIRKASIEAMRPPYETPFWGKLKAPAQIVKVAEGDALRSTFPTLLGGLYTGDELSLDVTERFVQPSNGSRITDSKLVETVATPATQPEAIDDGEGTDLGPQSQREAAVESRQPAEGSAKADLQKFVTDEGFTFSHLQSLGADIGIENADSMSSFDEIPEATAKRLLRAKTGLKQGLTQAKLAGGGKASQ